MKPTQERAAIAAELESTLRIVAEMQAEIDQLKPKGWQPDSVVNPRLSELRRSIGGVEAKARTLQEKLDRLARVDAYQRQVAQAGAVAKTAKQAMDKAEKEATDLEEKAAQARQRAKTMEELARQAEEDAQANEAEFVRAYAAAVSAGDTKAEKAAHVKVQEAQAASANIKVRHQKEASLLMAIHAEATAIEAKAVALRVEADAARKAMLVAIKTGLGAEWDAKAAELMGIGAKLLAVEAFAGLDGGNLDRLRLPLFAVGGADYLGSDELRSCASALSMADLLAGGEVLQ